MWAKFHFRGVRVLIVVAGGLALAPAAAQAASPSAYVANASGASVAQYDIGAAGLLAPKSPATVAAGMNPTGIAVSPDGSSAYVTNGNAGVNTVSQFDIAADGTLSPKSPATVATGSLPVAVALTPDGKSAYVTNGAAPAATAVSQYDIDPATGGLTAKSPATVGAGESPRGVAVTPDGTSAYVTNFDGPMSASTVSQYDIDPATGKLTAKSTATAGAGVGPLGVAVSPDGKSAYVANSNLMGAGTVSQYDIGAGGLLAPKSPATVATDPGPVGVAVTPDGRSAYVTNNGGGDGVSQYDIDPATGKLTPKAPATVAAGFAPRGVAVSPDGTSVYVANQFDNSVSQYDIDPATGKLTPKSPATVAAGAGPDGVAVTPQTPPEASPSGDTQPPETTITKGPKNKLKTRKKKAKASFEFISSEPGSTFECSLDGGPFEPCTSPETNKVKAKRKGKKHEFEVRAKDAAGNTDPTPATDEFKVKRKR